MLTEPISEENKNNSNKYDFESRDAYTRGLYKSLEVANSSLRILKKDEDCNVKYGIQLVINEILMCINRRCEEENRSLREDLMK